MAIKTKKDELIDVTKGLKKDKPLIGTQGLGEGLGGIKPVTATPSLTKKDPKIVAGPPKEREMSIEPSVPKPGELVIGQPGLPDPKGVGSTPRDITDDKGNIIGKRSDDAMEDITRRAETGLKKEEGLLTEEQQKAELLKQAEYAKKIKQQEEYMTSQREKQERVDELTGDVRDIESSKRIDDTRKQLAKLKRNIAYLGTLGKPGVSSIRMEAVDQQISDAERVFSDLKDVEASLKAIRKTGEEYDSDAFERRIQLLQDDLDAKVSEPIQNALNMLSAAEIDGKIDSIEDLNKFRLDVLDMVDRSVEGITMRNIQLRQDAINEYKDIIKDQKLIMTNKQKVNKEMSSAQGFYVDGNGDPLISATTGGVITIPKEATMDPIFDKETGKLIQFKTDENGKIVASVDDIIDSATFEQETVSNYAKLVAQGRLDIDDVPDNIRSTDAFVKQLAETEITESTEPESLLDKAKREEIEKRTELMGGTNYEIRNVGTDVIVIDTSTSKVVNRIKGGVKAGDTADWTISGGYMLNKRTGEKEQLEGGAVSDTADWSISGDYIYNKRTGAKEKLEGGAVATKTTTTDRYITPGAGKLFDTETREFITEEELSKDPTVTVTKGKITTTPGTTKNIPNKNNNPGNIKMGTGVKYGVSDMAVGQDNQGHLIFPDAQTGLDAMDQTVQGIMDKFPGIKIGQLIRAEDKGWNKKVAGFAGVDMNTKMEDIPRIDLLKAMARQEGFDYKNINQEVTTTKEETTGELTTEQKLAAVALAGEMKGSRAKEAIQGRTKLIKDRIREGLTIDDIQDEIRKGKFGTEFVGSYKSAYETISSDFTPEKAGRNQDILEDKIADFGEDSSQVKSFVKKLALDALGPTSARAVKGEERLVKMLDTIGSDLKELEEMGGKTNILEGTAIEIKKKIGLLGDDPISKKQGVLVAKIQTAIQKYRQAISGAAFTEPESKEYKTIFPSVGNTGSLNSALIEALKDSTNLSIDSTYGFVMGDDEYSDIFKGGNIEEGGTGDTELDDYEAFEVTDETNLY